MEKKFIQWLASQEMFKGMSEDALIKEINTLAEKDPDTVKALVAEFNKSQKFAKGGKIDHMVSKFQNGGAALRKAQRQEYKSAMDAMRNDEEMNKYRRGYLRDMAKEAAAAVTIPESSETSPAERIRPRDVYDRDEARQLMLDKGVRVKQTRTDWDGNVLERTRKGNVGDGRVLVKKAKSAAVDGFDESMYNWDPNQEFDRQRFRERKREAREDNPEWNWRQRRAWALADNERTPNVNTSPKNPNIELPSIWEKKIDIPAFTRGRGTVYVGDAQVADVERLPEEKKYTLVAEKAKIAPKRMGFDQFAGMLDDRMRAQKSLSTGSDTTNFQAWRANEYKKYAADPGNYTWTAMPDGYKASREEMRQLRAEGLLANRRGTGYYDPNDNSQAYIFGNKSWMQQHLDKGLDPTKRAYHFIDQYGNPVTNEQELAVAASHIKDPEIRKHFERYLNTGEMPTTTPAGTVTAQEQNVGKVGQSDFSKAMNAVQAGIVATAAAPVVVEATTDAAKELGKYAYKAGKQMIQNGRSMYGQTPQQMLQQNRWYTWSQSRLPNVRFGPNVFKGGQFTTGFGNGYGQMAPHAYNLWRPGVKLSGEVISQLPSYLQPLAPFLKTGGKIEK